jgi:hypothetical protein
MKRLIFIALIVTTLSASAAFGQDEKRIEFAKGKSSATVKGNSGQNGVYYVVRAKQGQMLVLDVAPASKVGVKVESNGRDGHQILLREERGGHFEVGLEEAGDYTIFVGSLNGKPAPFTLTVKIRRLTDI